MQYSVAMNSLQMQLPGILGERFVEPQILGSGSFAVVLKVHDLRRNEEVALKLESPSGDLAPELLQNVQARFRREAKVASLINHPNVVRTYEFGVAENRAFLVCEYLESVDMKRALAARTTAYPLDEACELAEKILLGLEAAHQAGVQHRDLKPANILLGKHGDVKIADFGLARHQDSMTLTLYGVRAGTPIYTAPEVFLGGEPCTPSDVYSFGILFLELLTGQTPFQDMNLLELRQAKTQWQEPNWGGQRSKIPRSIRGLVEACLQIHSKDRPANAGEIRKAFKKARDAYLVTSSLFSPSQIGIPVPKSQIGVPIPGYSEGSSQGDREWKILSGLLILGLGLLTLLLLASR
jgi:serine/threonine protein kinase